MLNEEECNEWGRQQRRRKRTFFQFHFGLFVLVFNEKFSFFTPCVLYTSCPFINSFFHSFEHRTFGETKTKTKRKIECRKRIFVVCFLSVDSFHFISSICFFYHFPIIFFRKKNCGEYFFCFETFESICLLFVDFFFLSKVDHQKSTKTKIEKKYSNLLSSSSSLFLKAKFFEFS